MTVTNDRVVATGAATRDGTSSRRIDEHDVRDVVTADRVGKTFTAGRSATTALRDVSLQVRQGEIVSIVGASGCGKTTLLRMIQGLESLSSGVLLVDGERPGRSNTRAGFVFQQPSLLPWFTVRRNIEFGLRLRRGRRHTSTAQRDQRVDRLLDVVGLRDFAAFHPHQLSGGMQQRVNLARALAIDPSVLLLDEPFSALDALTRERLQVDLGESLAALGTTAVLVTHDIREAVFLSDRVLVMGDRPGRIVAEVAVPAPRPRGIDLQHGDLFASLARTVDTHLRDHESLPT